QARACRIRAVIRSEKQYRTRNFFRLPKTTKRVSAQSLRQPLRRVVLNQSLAQGRSGCAWSNAVDTDTMWRVIDSHRTCQTDDGPFGCAVGSHARQSNKAGNR